MKKRLTTRETEVLEWIEMRANATAKEIARGIGSKEHVVRRIVDTLLEQRLIHRYVHLNVYPLGFFEVDLFVTFRQHSDFEIEDFIQWCMGNEKVCFLAEIVGRFHLKIGLTVRNMIEVRDFIESASVKFKLPFTQKEIATVIELFDFGSHKPLKGQTAAVLRFGFGSDQIEFTQDDHEILKVLSRHPEMSPSSAARHTGMPPSTFAYRMQRLEKNGVIAGYRYLYDPQGRSTEYFHGLVNLGGVTPVTRRKFYEFCSKHPKIPFFAELNGVADFMFCMGCERSNDTVAIFRELERSLLGYSPTVDVEVYSSPTLRKLAKYPFERFAEGLGGRSR